MSEASVSAIGCLPFQSEYTQQQSDPPGRDYPPANPQERWIIGPENRRVGDREVFDANARGHLIVQDAVDDRRKDAQGYDCQ